MLVPAFTGTTTFTLPFRSSFDLELAAAKYIYSLPDGNVPLDVQLHRHDLLPRRRRADADRADPLGLLRGVRAAGGDLARHDPRPLPEAAAGWRSKRHSSTGSAARKADLGLPSYDATVAALLEEGAMSGVDELVDSLLYEGYALYPYTPGAAKNATPTPFGIVYPPAYAETLPTAFDHLRMDCALEPDGEPKVSATVRFLTATGERHQGEERRVELPEPGEAVEFEFGGVRGPRARCGSIRATAARCGACACACTTRPRCDAAGMERAGALNAEPALHARGGAGRGRALPLRARPPRARQREHLAGAGRARRHGGGRRRLRAARPPADLAPQPRQPVRQHRDRGGAAAARAHALRRRARDDRRAGPGGARDGGARGRHHAAGPDGPPRDHAAVGADRAAAAARQAPRAAWRGVGGGRRRDLPPRRHRCG